VGVRHVVVHAAGVTSEDFVKRHPGVVKKSGDRLQASIEDVEKFVEAMKSFSEATEAFFLRRFPALIHAAPPPARHRSISILVAHLKTSILGEKPNRVTRG
jgi:hypothetical protein